MAFTEIGYGLVGEQIAIGKFAHAWPIRIKRNDGVNGKLNQYRDRGRLVPQCHRRDDCKVTAGAVPRSNKASHFEPQFGWAGRNPTGGGFAIFGWRGKRVFRRQAVINRNNRQIEQARNFGAIRLVGIKAANHKTAAMVEHHDWAGAAFCAAVIDARGNRTCWAGNFNVTNDSQLTYRRIGNITHRSGHRARFFGRNFPEFGAGNGVQKLQEQRHVRADKGGGFGHLNLHLVGVIGRRAGQVQYIGWQLSAEPMRAVSNVAVPPEWD